MKYKTTAKAVKDGYVKVFSVGYCDVQTLMNYRNPVAYTCGVYGWNADIYELKPQIALVTGYRPFGEHIDYKIVEKYEKKAKEIYHGKMWREHYEEVQGDLEKLIADFTDEVLEQYGI